MKGEQAPQPQQPSHAHSEVRRSRLGEILVANGSITSAQLDHALAQQTTLKLPIGQILLKLDYVTDETMRQALGLQLNVPYLNLENVMIDRSLARIVNATFAKKHALLPVATVGRTLTVAMDDPTAVAIVQDLTRLTGFSVTVVTSSSRAIQRAFRRLYDDVPDAQEGSRSESSASRLTSPGIVPATDGVVGPRADRLISQLLAAAMAEGATDLHLDASPERLAVRLRVDGALRQPDLGPLQEELDQDVREVAARLRTIARLDVSEMRLPQSGRAQMDVKHNGQAVPLELRVSVVPASRGDSVSIRLLDRAPAPRGLDDLALSADAMNKLRELLTRKSGVLLVTGQPLAAMTALLHGCLTPFAGAGVRVVSAEDPIAYAHEGVAQVEVSAEERSSYAAVLRGFLRHDPDVVMVTDIPDRDTAALVFKLAQQGTLVLAGASASVAVDAIGALGDLGVSASAIGDALIGVAAIRRARALCKNCGGKTRGCKACGGTGFAGELMLVDLWAPDRDDAALIVSHAPGAELVASARRTTLSMLADARSRLAGGQTTREELRRVLPAAIAAEL